MGKITLKSSLSLLAFICIVFGCIAFANAVFPFIQIIFNKFRYIDENPFNPFQSFFLIGLCIAVGAALVLSSIIYFFMQCRKNIRKAILPFLVNIIIFLIVWLAPTYGTWMTLNFKLNSSSDYNKIILMVEDGHVQSDNNGLADLPPGYHHLSRGGDIFINKGLEVTTVLFHTSFNEKLTWGRGLTTLGGFSGYMYRSDGTPPPQYFEGLDWIQVKKIEPNWFYYDSMIVDK